MVRTKSTGCGALAVLLVATTATAQPAPASDAEATAVAHAREAEGLAKAGDFAGAAALFEQAFALNPKPEYTCNIGVAYYKGSDLPRAQFFLTQCMLQGSSLASTFLDSVRKVQATVESKLRAGDFTPVSLSVAPAGAKVAVASWRDDETFIGARTVWLPWGEQALTVSAEGYVTRAATLTLGAHERQDVKVQLEREAVVVVTPPPDQLPLDNLPPSDGKVARPIETPAPPPSKTPALVATIATGVVALGAGGAYVRALGKASDARKLVDGTPPHTTLADDAKRYRAIAVGGAILAGIGAGVAVYLWMRARPRTEHAITAGIAPSTSGTGAQAFLAGNF